MNASINETLSRTLLTSGCTLLSVAALYFFGGPVLHDFAFAILIGIGVGTHYSSISHRFADRSLVERPQGPAATSGHAHHESEKKSTGTPKIAAA